MIDALYITAEDAIRTKAAGAMVTEGQPVALNASGELIGATAGTSVYGVSKLDSNAYRNFAFGEFGAFGTGKLTVVTKGIVRIKDSVYSGIEVDTSTTEATDATIVLLATVTFHVNEKVYADATGLITNVDNDGAAFGRVIATPEMTGGWLEVEVDTSWGAEGISGTH